MKPSPQPSAVALLRSNSAMDFRVETVYHHHQRYDTVGDWLFDGRTLTVRISRLGDWRKQFLVLMHELTEAALCIKTGVTQQQVDHWDFEHTDAEEPGEVEGAPYFEQHAKAIEVERLLAEALGFDFAEYERSLHHGNKEDAR